MATVYNISIKTTSAFLAYPPEDIKGLLENILSKYKDKKTGLGFENTVVVVTEYLPPAKVIPKKEITIEECMEFIAEKYRAFSFSLEKAKQDFENQLRK